MADHVQSSLDRILRSGQYVCRPQRQIFVEHTFKNSQGQVTRQVTPADLQAIAATGNANAANTGDLAPIGFGHTFDDIMDDNGQLVRKFSEADQPKPIGYLHNYTVRQRSDGKWALYADEWIQRIINDERGQPVDGVQYAETFPRRSAEYFPGKKWIDWLALLRRSPALNMGLDIYAYANLHPDKVHYSVGGVFGAVVDSRGKWRYAHEEESMDTGSGPSGASTPPESPASPPDDRPPLPPEGNHDPMQDPIHQQAAEKYSMHCNGMHPTQSKALLHHMHSQYSAQLGLPADKMAQHVPPPVTAPPPAVPPGAPPGGPAPPAIAPPGKPTPMDAGAAAAPPGGPHQQHSPVGLSGDSSWKKPEHEQHAAVAPGPGVGPAFIPGSEEHKRMSAVQQGVEAHRSQTQADKDRYELQQLRESVATMQTETRKSRYERDLTALMAQGYEFTLSKEVERMAPVRYDEAACNAHIACIKENYAKQPISLGNDWRIVTGDVPNGLPSRGKPDMPEKVSYEESQKARKYASQHECTFDEALVKIRGA